MYTLSNTWITDPRIESEYKYYCLKAYQQSLLNAVERWELEPAATDVQKKLEAAIQLLHTFKLLKASFPKEIRGMSPSEMGWHLVTTENFSEAEREIIATLNFAIPMLENTLAQVTARIEEGQNHVRCEPIGLIPAYRNEGLLFILDGWRNRLIAYRYKLRTLFPQIKLSLQHIASNSWKAGLNLDTLRLRLGAQLDLPFPASYLCACTEPIPLNSGLLPLARRQTLAHTAGLQILRNEERLK